MRCTWKRWGHISREKPAGLERPALRTETLKTSTLRTPRTRRSQRNSDVIFCALSGPCDLCVKRFVRSTMKRSKGSSRRQVLRIGAAAVTGGILARPDNALGLETPGKLGIPLGPYGERSPYKSRSAGGATRRRRRRGRASRRFRILWERSRRRRFTTSVIMQESRQSIRPRIGS